MKFQILKFNNVSNFNSSIEEKEEALIDKESAIAIIKAGCDMSNFGDTVELPKTKKEIDKDFQEFLLTAPIMSDEQNETFKQNRKNWNRKW